MYYLGYDVGSSSVKAAIIDGASGKKLAVLHEPSNEMGIHAPQKDWAEQDPDLWYKHLCTATKRVVKEAGIDVALIKGIGISYQMHGLVVVDKHGKPLRNAIIWCDSRAVEIGKKATAELGKERCDTQLLNEPGNFTASKLKWVRDQQPELYEKIHKYMLPGDYIAYKLTGDICTTKNGLSEGILWDYKKDQVANWLLDYYDLDTSLTPEIVENFSDQGLLTQKAAEETGLQAGIPIRYRAGDQPNNALSLGVFEPGEVAATGGTSGVIYAVTDSLQSNQSSRINHFAHVNYSKEHPRIGKLMCINGAGIQYRWFRNINGEDSYEAMNRKASKVDIGSDGIVVIPFGNGAERILNNTNTGTQICNINLNKHGQGHLYRAALEGIAFSFVYGMELLQKDTIDVSFVRAGSDNLFRSEIFSNTVATLIGHEIEIYNTTGAIGAARAASMHSSDLSTLGEGIAQNDHVMNYVPLKSNEAYLEAYENWKKQLNTILKYT